MTPTPDRPASEPLFMSGGGRADNQRRASSRGDTRAPACHSPASRFFSSILPRSFLSTAARQPRTEMRVSTSRLPPADEPLKQQLIRPGLRAERVHC